MSAHVGRVDHGALGTANFHRVADLERVHVLGDSAGRVRLDHEVEIAFVLFVGGYRGVRPNDLLVFPFDIGCERYMLSDGQTQDIGFFGKGKAVAVEAV